MRDVHVRLECRGGSAFRSGRGRPSTSTTPASSARTSATAMPPKTTGTMSSTGKVIEVKDEEAEEEEEMP